MTMFRPVRVLLAVAVAGVLALPYARPVACDVSGHTATHMDHEGSTNVAWSALNHSNTCHDLSHCAIALGAPVLEPAQVQAIPEHGAREPGVATRAATDPGSEISPPPRA